MSLKGWTVRVPNRSHDVSLQRRFSFFSSIATTDGAVRFEVCSACLLRQNVTLRRMYRSASVNATYFSSFMSISLDSLELLVELLVEVSFLLFARPPPPNSKRRLFSVPVDVQCWC